jgi:hypothetical protein
VIGESEEEGLAAIHLAGDYLNHEALFEASQSSVSTDYKKRDFLFRAGNWRNETVLPVGREGSNAETLIVGHSDITTSVIDIARIRARSSYKRVLCANLFPSNHLFKAFGAEPLPLGLSNPTNESELHKVYGDASAVTSAFAARASPLASTDITHVYANFRAKTAPGARSDLSELVRALRHVKVEEPNSTPLGRAQYLTEIRLAGLVVCPRGNGPDTHRLYETLYLGGIPIVLKDSYQHRICRVYGFPVIGLKGWAQLADFSLLKKMGEAENFSPKGVSRLRLSGWMRYTGLLT